MPTRHVYLKIEQITEYSPVAPDPMAGAPAMYGRDCMRNEGHEDATIPMSEITARTLGALVYREYLDPSYIVPKPDKIILADINEPAYHRRVPGTVIYASPGDRLKIHVLNADSSPHSFHMHGLLYGIDSDGSWPLGTQSSDGRRSDEICPGQSWIYTYDVTDKMIGAWPFHDHCHQIGANINRGLFGGLVVLPAELEAPPRTKLPPEIEELLAEIEAQHGHKEREEAEEQGEGKAAEAREEHTEKRRAAKKEKAARRELVAHPEHGMRGPLEGLQINLEEWLHLPDVHPRVEAKDVLHVPLFFHYMGGSGGVPAFDLLLPLGGFKENVFGVAGTFTYHCNFHPSMRATVIVATGGAALQTVNIVDTDPMNMHFDQATVTVRPGGKVRWQNLNNNLHSVTEDAGGIPSFCFNGRSFVGNTPTIVAEAGQRIRWYVFNLDLGMMWHNFHPHSQRWQFAGEAYDGRSLGPAESFVVETTAPPVLLLPPAIEKAQHGRHPGAHEYRLRGDFLFHCHVEMHMMGGLAGLVRSRQTLWLTPAQAKQLRSETGLPLDGGDNDCPPIDPDRCKTNDCGKWEEVPGSPSVTFMHAALLPNSKRLVYWGYGDARDDISRVFDYSAAPGAFLLPANQPFDVTSPIHNRPLANLWSAEHTFLDDAEGSLLVHGGFTPRESYRFHPSTLLWSRTANTNTDARFYSTTLTLADGKALTIFGGSSGSVPSHSIEIYDPVAGTWAAPVSAAAVAGGGGNPGDMDYLYYPWAYLLPGGELFVAGPRRLTRRFAWAAPVNDPAKTWSTIGGNRSTGGEKATSVLLPLLPPDYKPRVIIAGGNTGTTQQTSEIIDLSIPMPAWTALPNLNQARPEQVNTVLLPDGHVLLAGGIHGAGGPAEILDSRNPSAGWVACAEMKYSRGYHSAAILLQDGSVLMGGDQAIMGGWKSGETTPHERYYPWYWFRARPVITSADATAAHGASFTVHTPNASSIAEVFVIRPGAVTHGFNMSQRMVGCVFSASGPTSLSVKAPPDGNVAPPGHYLVFIVDAARVPSEAAWIRLTP